MSYCTDLSCFKQQQFNIQQQLLHTEQQQFNIQQQLLHTEQVFGHCVTLTVPVWLCGYNSSIIFYTVLCINVSVLYKALFRTVTTKLLASCPISLSAFPPRTSGHPTNGFSWKSTQTNRRSFYFRFVGTKCVNISRHLTSGFGSNSKFRTQLPQHEHIYEPERAIGHCHGTPRTCGHLFVQSQIVGVDNDRGISATTNDNFWYFKKTRSLDKLVWSSVSLSALSSGNTSMSQCGGREFSVITVPMALERRRTVHSSSQSCTAESCKQTEKKKSA